MFGSISERDSEHGGDCRNNKEGVLFLFRIFPSNLVRYGTAFVIKPMRDIITRWSTEQYTTFIYHIRENTVERRNQEIKKRLRARLLFKLK